MKSSLKFSWECYVLVRFSCYCYLLKKSCLSALQVLGVYEKLSGRLNLNLKLLQTVRRDKILEKLTYDMLI